jgi:hypothetical protein
MKKTLVSFTISFACLISFFNFVNADTISITTADVDAWQVAKLMQAQVAAGSSKKNRDITDVVFKNYQDGYSTVTNTDKTLSKGDALNYGNVKQTYILKPIPSAFQDIALTTPEAKPGGGLSADGNIYPVIDNASESPGYYAFQTTFSLSPEIVDLSGVFMNINLDIVVDDLLEGIFLNGYELTKYSSYRGLHGASGTQLRVLDINGSLLLNDLIEQGLFFTDTANTLEFVVRNDVMYRDGIYYYDQEYNGFFFAALGDINFGDQQYENSFAPTPEPATLLICLTCGGLALAIRRRKNKKTE